MSKNIPQIESSTKFNFVTSIWIVPFAALLIAAWLAYQYYSELGPEIKIIFPNNEGLQAGQSVIKYRDVTIGKVTKIHLENDGSQVAVYARMEKTAESFLNEHTKFWIVKPEVGMGGISGLDTLISGTYINVYAQKGEEYRTVFTGLPYIYRADRGGEYFHLNAPEGYNITQGTPIFFKNIKVGEVEYVTVSLDGRSIDFYVYIDKAYVPYIHTDSKFWIRSALDVDISNGRLNVNIAPLSHLIQGGISFSSSGEDPDRPVPDGHLFALHKNISAAEEQRGGKGGKAVERFELHVLDSVAKLKQEAPVRYEGYEVGRVTKVSTAYDPETHKMAGTVHLQIDTSFFESRNDQNITGKMNFKQAVEEGLRAKIAATDPITGTLYVDLVFKEHVPYRAITQGEKYPVLPSVSDQSSDLMGQFNVLLARLNTLLESTNQVVDENTKPLHETLTNLNETIKHINSLVAMKETQDLPGSLDQSIKKLTQTLESANRVLKGYEHDSLMNNQLAQTLKMVTETSEEMTRVLRMINRKPNALIFGEE
ncbi:MlaD family protein [Sulfurovum sp.]|uniref:PqiB family protein n=1 Tax=Sulfurovum sp. TaxID=1969726 RepID=UPI002A365A0E|nr:MlaD family protein [Sulfurovum sp.]MDD2451982.1 MlaD family protein [Sulfurovum sp.]MDD3499782.1 MlaD family protein [Sulfurovum sp.]MDY0403551.1 MlaD family protein [Sulfurovum sp.]